MWLISVPPKQKCAPYSKHLSTYIMIQPLVSQMWPPPIVNISLHTYIMIQPLVSQTHHATTHQIPRARLHGRARFVLLPAEDKPSAGANSHPRKVSKPSAGANSHPLKVCEPSADANSHPRKVHKPSAGTSSYCLRIRTRGGIINLPKKHRG